MYEALKLVFKFAFRGFQCLLPSHTLTAIEFHSYFFPEDIVLYFDEDQTVPSTHHLCTDMPLLKNDTLPVLRSTNKCL